MLNKVILIGRLTKDPEIRKTQSGKIIASFCLATSEHWKDKTTGEKKQKTEFSNIVVYNENIAKVIENYVKKGSQIYIEGSLQTRKWQDKDGKDRYTTEVVLQNFDGKLVLLGGKSDNTQADVQESSYASAELDDDVPF